MFLLPAVQINLLGVADAGVPNSERIIIRPNEAVNLAKFGIMLATLNPDGSVTPMIDSFFWFGEVIVNIPSWIIVYTGPGQYQVSSMPNTQHTAYSFHWGRKTTIFFDPTIVPVVFSMDGILVGNLIPPSSLIGR
jgi:hypothetical protein